VIAARDLRSTGGNHHRSFPDAYVGVSVQGGGGGKRKKLHLGQKAKQLFQWGKKKGGRGGGGKGASAGQPIYASASSSSSSATTANAAGSSSSSSSSSPSGSFVGGGSGDQQQQQQAAAAPVWEERMTYFVRQNRSPKWDENQEFVFDMPPEASRHPRMFTLRFRVMDHKDFLHAGEFLGQVFANARLLRVC
jgi:hypothetical protein